MWYQNLQYKNFFIHIVRSVVRNYFQADTILLGGMSVKKNFNHFTINLRNEDMINKILHV